MFFFLFLKPFAGYNFDLLELESIWRVSLDLYKSDDPHLY